MIKKLSQKTSEIIKSQQYINNTYTITKELLENSLDSNATVIKIIIDEDLIRVDDNGSGIEILTDVGNEGVTSKHSTTYFVLGLNEDSTNLYCGYRGLALCSIKNMCDLEIISKHENNETAYKKNMSTGNISPCARQVGTTVNVTRIFHDCPIRKKLNIKNMPKYLKLIQKLVEAYSLVYQTNFLVKYKGNTLINKKGHSSLQEYCRNNYKSIINDCLEKESKQYYLFMLPLPVAKEESRIFYGKRHVTSKKILKEIKQVYNLYKEGIPLFYLELRGIIDFNISPDKSEILFENEDEIIGFIKEDIMNYFSTKIYGERKIDETLSFFNEKYPENINKDEKYKEINNNTKNLGGVIKLQKSSKIFPESFSNEKIYLNIKQHEIPPIKPFINLKRTDIEKSHEIQIVKDQTDENKIIKQNDNLVCRIIQKDSSESQNNFYDSRNDSSEVHIVQNDYKESQYTKNYVEENQSIQNDFNDIQNEFNESRIVQNEFDDIQNDINESQNTQTAIDEFISKPLQRQHEPSDSFIQITELETSCDEQTLKNNLKRELSTPMSSNYFDIKDGDISNPKKPCITNILEKGKRTLDPTFEKKNF